MPTSVAKRQPLPSARALLAGNIIRLRQAKGWSQEALAFEANLHRTFVAHVERQARNISLDNLERLALALQVLPHELLLLPAAMEGHR
jgi:transcriptional regulator with XRE-family HTH domain